MFLVSKKYVDTRIKAIKSKISNLRSRIKKLEFTKAELKHNHDGRYALKDHAHEGSSKLIDAPIVQAVPYESTPTAQPVKIKINGTGIKTLTIWRGNGVSVSISDAGCNVIQEDPFTMQGDVTNLNSNLEGMTVTIPTATFPQDQTCGIRIGVDDETQEIFLQPIPKTW